MKIVYIHGAGASKTSFNYIRQIVAYDEIFLEYSTKISFTNNLTEMFDKLEEQNKDDDDMIIVSHSLGGIYAVHIAQLLFDRVKGIFSMSCPFGGIEVADILKFIKSDDLYWEIGPNDKPIRAASRIKLECPHWMLVTKGGETSLIAGSNDGVVSERSQVARIGDKMFTLNLNHFEVLLHPTTVKHLSDFIDLLEKKKYDPTR